MNESFTSVDLLAIKLRAEAGSDAPQLLAVITELLAALEPFAHEEFGALETRNWAQARAVYERLAPAHLHPIDGRGSMPNDTRRDRPLYEEIEWTEEDEAAADRALERLIAEEQPALDENGEDDLDRLWRERGLLDE